MPPQQTSRQTYRPVTGRAGGQGARPYVSDGTQLLGVRAAGILFIVSAVISILRVTVLKAWLPTEATAGQMYGSAFFQVMLGVALLQGSKIARRFVLVLATLGLVALLIAMAFLSEAQEAGPIVWLVAAVLVTIPYVALVLLLVGEDHSRLRVGLCIAVLAVYSLGAWAIEIGARRALERRVRGKIAEWVAATKRFENPGLGVTVEPPAGWVVLRDDSPPVKNNDGRIGFAHRESIAIAVLIVDEIRDGPGTPRAELDRIREKYLKDDEEVEELGVVPSSLGEVEAQELTVRVRSHDQHQRAWFVLWRDGWRYFTLYGWAPEARADLAGQAFAQLERSIRFSPVVSKDFGDLMGQVAQTAPHLSPAAVRALLDRLPNRRLTAGDVFRLGHRWSLRGVEGLTPAEVEELGRLTTTLYGAMNARDRSRLGSYQERVRADRPTTPAEDAEMARAMKTGTDRLPPASLQRLQELLEKAIAMGVLMERS